MKYIDEFRDGELARHLAGRIAAAADPGRTYRLMEFCGGHTHAISRYGVTDLLPANVTMIHGPGCPVCVLPIGRVDLAIQLALERGAIVCTYGDCLRVPASDGLSLLKAKARGGAASGARSRLLRDRLRDDDAAHRARRARRGAARRRELQRAVQPRADAACDGAPAPLDGFVGPAHVSTVIGSRPYEFVAREHHKPVVIAGFEPLDVMQAILMLVQQVNDGRAEVENEFTRAVTRDGNAKAQALVAEVFEVRPSFEWRGLGEVPASALRLRDAWAALDAERRFGLETRPVADAKACECGAILRGAKHPRDCKVFGTVCTPENPIGSCMVSSEGACAAYYTYGRFREIPLVAA